MGDAVAFIVENGRITILRMEDEFLGEITFYYVENHYVAFQLWQGDSSYRVIVRPEGSVGQDIQTGEEFEIYVTSTMRHTGPEGRFSDGQTWLIMHKFL